MTHVRAATVLITGGANGIGRAVAREAAGRGARVVVWDLDAEQAEHTAAALPGAAALGHRGYRCDVTEQPAVAALAERVVADVGPVDVLVNNAGVVSGKPLLDLTEDDIRTTFDVNVLALYWVTRAFLPAMVARGRGHVVTIASAASLIGVAKQTDYAASKHAAMGFDESLRMELRQRAPGVRTTVVCPFYVDTGMFEGVQSRFPRLLPILEQDDVARRVVDAVERNRRRLIMPPFVRLLPAARLLPTPVFDALADFLGVNVSMAEFVGRTRPDAVLGGAPGRRETA